MITRIRNLLLRNPRTAQAIVLTAAVVAGLGAMCAVDPMCEAGTVTAIRNDTVYIAFGRGITPDRVICIDADTTHRKLYEFLRAGDVLKYKNAAHADTLHQTPEIISVNARKYPQFLESGIGLRGVAAQKQR